MLIVLQIQKIMLETDKIYVKFEHYSLYIENFLKIKENQDHHLKTKIENYIDNPSGFKWVKKNEKYIEYK